MAEAEGNRKMGVRTLLFADLKSDMVNNVLHYNLMFTHIQQVKIFFLPH